MKAVLCDGRYLGCPRRDDPGSTFVVRRQAVAEAHPRLKSQPHDPSAEFTADGTKSRASRPSGSTMCRQKSWPLAHFYSRCSCATVCCYSPAIVCRIIQVSPSVDGSLAQSTHSLGNPVGLSATHRCSRNFNKAWCQTVRNQRSRQRRCPILEHHEHPTVLHASC